MKKVLVLLLFITVPAFGEIYTWTDAQGTRHYTNSMYDVPERYRAKVKTLDLGSTPTAAPTATPTPTPQQPEQAPAAAPLTVRPETRNATPPPVRVDRRRRVQTSGERDN